METTFGECTDNEKKETVISDCSEMRTEGTSRPSVGLVGTARDDYLTVSIHGVMILKISKLAMAICTQKACFRGRTRDSGTQSQIAPGSPWPFLRWTRPPNLERRVRNYDPRKPFCEKSLPY